MIATTLIRHQFYALFRSNRAFNNFLLMLFESLSLLIFAVGLFAFGLWSPILVEDWLHRDAITAGAILLIPIGSLGLFFRLMAQGSDYLPISGYRLLPIPRQILAHYVILRPLANPATHLELLYFIPYCIMSGIRTENTEGAFFLFINAWLMEMAHTLLAAAVHRKFRTNLTYRLTVYFSYILFIGILWKVPEAWHDDILASLIALFTAPWGWQIWVFTGVASYGWHYRYFKLNWYEESSAKKRKEQIHSNRFVFLMRYGSTGIMLHFLLKQYLRCPVLKANIVGFFILIAYCWVYSFFYNMESLMPMVVGSGVILTSRYTFSGNSAHFDGIMTLNIRLQDYVRAQYYLIMIFECIAILLTCPLMFINNVPLVLFMVIASCNLGVMPLQTLWMSTHYTHYLDVNKRKKFTHENLSLTYALNSLIIILVPLILGLWAKYQTPVTYTVMAINLLAVMLHRQIIRLITLQLQKKKYHMAAGFRER